MEVIDVRKREEGVQRSIDGGGHAVLAIGRERIVADHLVFVLFAAVDVFELLEAVEIEQREAVFVDGAEVAAAAFHREHAHRLAGKRIGQFDFCAGVATAKIGNAEVCAEQVGAVAQLAQRAVGEGALLALVPEIFDVQ